MAQAELSRRKQQTPTISAQDEALAVLIEMERRAEQRLIEAGGEFQDIAHEMEWRLLDWQRLSDERRKLEHQLDLIARATPRFNLRARRVTASQASGRKDNWSRMVRLLQTRIARNAVALEDALGVILSRNEEGRILQDEIFALQDRIRRISLSLRRLHGPSTLVVREGDAAAALARLSLDAGRIPDLPNPATLITAACAVTRGVLESGRTDQ